jgi:DNA-binding CsgD family transcriptional regulator
VAVPVEVRRQVRAVLYGGLRQAMSVGDRVLDQILATSRELARDIEAEDARRVRAAVPAPRDAVDRSALRSVVRELATVAGEIREESLRDRLRTASDLVLGPPTGSFGGSRALLTHRELGVLDLAGSGCTNVEIAELLDLTPHAVKSLLRSSMRKLDVHSRHAAVSEARAAGILG